MEEKYKRKLTINDYNSLVKIFKKIDYESNLFFIKSNLKLYNQIKLELQKRHTNYRIDDYNYLFFNNLEILNNFVDKFYNIEKNKKTIQNTKIKLKINDYRKLTNNEKFYVIFDKIILLNNRINKKKYQNFFEIKRKELNLIKTIDLISIKYIYELNKLKKLSKKIDFIVKKIKKENIIKIYVLDLQVNEFMFLFNALSTIYNSSTFKIVLTTKLEQIVNSDNKGINIYLAYNSDIFDKKFISEKRYILSIVNLENDLKTIFSNESTMIDKNLELTISEKKSIYNKRHYVSNRVKGFIEQLRKEEDEFQKFINSCI